MKRLTLLIVSVIAGMSLAACGENMNHKTPEKGTQVHPTSMEQNRTMHPTHEVKPDMNTNTGTTNPTNPTTIHTPSTPTTTHPTTH